MECEPPQLIEIEQLTLRRETSLRHAKAGSLLSIGFMRKRYLVMVWPRNIIYLGSNRKCQRPRLCQRARFKVFVLN